MSLVNKKSDCDELTKTLKNTINKIDQNHIKVYSKNKIIGLCLDLTTDKEEIIIDEIGNICERFNKSEDKNKREFVIVIS